MKTQELINLLKECDPESTIEISVNQINNRWPVDYCNIENVINKQNGKDSRIIITIADNLKIIKRQQRTYKQTT